jgi:hypothetical protein
MDRGGCPSFRKAIYILKQTSPKKKIPNIYVSMCLRILKDIVHHHLLFGESIFYLGGKLLEMQFGEKCSKDKFPKE